MAAHRIGHAVLGRVDPEGELGAEHRGQPDGAGGLGVADHAVQPVVVGEGEGLQSQPGRLLGQLLGREAPSRKLKLEWQCSSA